MTNERLAAVETLLMSMKPAEAVQAEQDLLAVLAELSNASVQQRVESAPRLRQIAALAQSAMEHWHQLTALAALNSSGYTADGAPAGAAIQTGIEG